MDPVEYGWYGALSLSMFGLVMSLLKKLDMNGKPLAAVNAGVVGAAAGAVAYLVWGAFSFDQPLSAYWAEGLKNSLIGARFGVGISLTLHLLKTTLLKRIGQTWLHYTGILGAVVFIALTLVNFPARQLSYTVIGLTGTVVMIAMAFSPDLFRGEKAAGN